MRDPWPGQVSRPEMVEQKNLKKENSNQNQTKQEKINVQNELIWIKIKLLTVFRDI